MAGVLVPSLEHARAKKSFFNFNNFCLTLFNSELANANQEKTMTKKRYDLSITETVPQKSLIISQKYEETCQAGQATMEATKKFRLPEAQDALTNKPDY